VSEQLPGWARPFDDRWGFTWRALSWLRRLSPQRTARFTAALLRPRPHTRPVFIVGVARSATTSLFRVLREAPELGALPAEGHDLWRAFHHPRYGGWRSDEVPAGAVRPLERPFVHAYLSAYFDQTRFVEKTPENAFRIPYLLDLFPDAHFVAVWRNPCEVIQSLSNGWREPRGRFRSYFVPQDLAIPDYEPQRQWCFALIDGWRELASSPIPEIALAQWRSAAGALASARSSLPAESWSDIYLEDWVAAPEAELARLLKRIDVRPHPNLTAAMQRFAEQPANALRAPPRPRQRPERPGLVAENSPEIQALLPRIAETTSTLGLGYRVDLTSGEVRRTRDDESAG
jgi:hypothetical protein